MDLLGLLLQIYLYGMCAGLCVFSLIGVIVYCIEVAFDIIKDKVK